VATGDARPDRRFVSFDEARATILAKATPLLMPTEFVPIDDALGRTLREDLIADEPFPAFDNSAMDGYAVRAADVASASPISPVSLLVVDTVAAGHMPTRVVGPGEATRIMTGAALPPGADAVVPVERTTFIGETVQVLAEVRSSDHVRPAGEDFVAGARLVTSGRVIDPGVISILAVLGHAEAEVALPPRVAIISTGDELVAPGKPVPPGHIRDSNTHTIRAMARASGCEVGPCWHVLDEPDAVIQAVRRVIDHCEVIVTLGGVSAGDFDPVKQALSSLGDVELWKVGMKPGQPQAFGTVGGKLFFGLPGNPVSSAVVFEMLVRPALWTLLGRSVLDRPVVRAVMAESVTSVAGRRDFLRVTLEAMSAEEAARVGAPYRARLTGTQSSGAMSSILKAQGLAVVEEAVTNVQSGCALHVLNLGIT
jgi:molybdopterin molybdotransferase